MYDDLLATACAIEDELHALRRWLHQHPEPSLAEYQTAAKVREFLDANGIAFFTVGATGTVGVIEGANKGLVVGLRADMDALEIQEHSSCSFPSQTPGMMHACGHDVHTAALLGAAKLLAQHRDELHGTVKLIFQPAEEIAQGAVLMVQSGLLDDVDAFFGIHVRPRLAVGTVALRSGPIMGGANGLRITLTGRPGHAGHPHEAHDALAAGAQIVGSLQHIVSRELSPEQAAVISLCQFHAGTRDNIIAGEAVLSGTIRVADERTRTQIVAAVERIVTGIAAAHRVDADIWCPFATPVLENAPNLYPVVVRAIENYLPSCTIVDLDPPIDLGTEDFSQYAAIAPSFFAFVGSGGEAALHNDHFAVDDSVVPLAAALYSAFVRQNGVSVAPLPRVG